MNIGKRSGGAVCTIYRRLVPLLLIFNGSVQINRKRTQIAGGLNEYGDDSAWLLSRNS